MAGRFLYILNRIDHKAKLLAACRNLSAFAFELPSQLPFTDRFGTEMIDAHLRSKGLRICVSTLLKARQQDDRST